MVWLQPTGDELHTPRDPNLSLVALEYMQKLESAKKRWVGRGQTGQEGGSRGQARGMCWLNASVFQTSLSQADCPDEVSGSGHSGQGIPAQSSGKGGERRQTEFREGCLHPCSHSCRHTSALSPPPPGPRLQGENPYPHSQTVYLRFAEIRTTINHNSSHPAASPLT